MVWERLSISLRGHYVREVVARRSSFQLLEHLLLHIEDIEDSIGEEGRRDWKRVNADSRADLQDAFPVARLEHSLQVMW